MNDKLIHYFQCKENQTLRKYIEAIEEHKQELRALICEEALEELEKQELRTLICEEIIKELEKQFGKHKDKYLYRENEAYNSAINTAISSVHKIEKRSKR